MRQKFNILKLIGKKTNNDKTVLRMVERWITKHGRHEWLENLLGIDIPRTVDLQIRRHTRKSGRSELVFTLTTGILFKQQFIVRYVE